MGIYHRFTTLVGILPGWYIPFLLPWWVYTVPAPMVGMYGSPMVGMYGSPMVGVYRAYHGGWGTGHTMVGGVPGIPWWVVPSTYHPGYPGSHTTPGYTPLPTTLGIPPSSVRPCTSSCTR